MSFETPAEADSRVFKKQLLKYLPWFWPYLNLWFLKNNKLLSSCSRCWAKLVNSMEAWECYEHRMIIQPDWKLNITLEAFQDLLQFSQLFEHSVIDENYSISVGFSRNCMKKKRARYYNRLCMRWYKLIPSISIDGILRTKLPGIEIRKLRSWKFVRADRHFRHEAVNVIANGSECITAPILIPPYLVQTKH